MHLQSSKTLASYSFAAVTFPADQVSILSPSALPPNWRASPAPLALQKLGDGWLDAARYAVLKVPSVIVPREHNYILNPSHPEFGRFTFGAATPYEFDSRLATS